MPILSLQNVSKDYATDGLPVPALAGFRSTSSRRFPRPGRTQRLRQIDLAQPRRRHGFPACGKWSSTASSLPPSTMPVLPGLRREKVGFIFQSFQLIHTLSVVENVELPLLLAGTATRGLAARAPS